MAKKILPSNGQLSDADCAKIRKIPDQVLKGRLPFAEGERRAAKIRDRARGSKSPVPKARGVRMKILTGVTVPPGASAQITEHAQRGFRPQSFVVTHPKEWVVHSVSLGLGGQNMLAPRRLQTAKLKGVYKLMGDHVVKQGEAVVVMVQYVGDVEEGRIFHGVIGRDPK